MKTSKILIAFFLVIAVLSMHVGAVFAAPANEAALLTGTVLSVTLETDVNTAVITVLVTLVDENNISQTIRLSQKTALDLGLLIPSGNGGIPVINPDALGKPIQINPKTVISDNEVDRHPVADALATFFSDIMDYDTIMMAHEKGAGLCEGGAGFGVIAQALWLTQKLKEEFEIDTAELFCAILSAKETGDFSYFAIVNDDGTTTIPKDWSQFRKAVLDKKDNLGMVMSKNKDKSNNGNGNENNGNGSTKGNGNNGKDNGNSKDNGNNKDNGKGKDK